MNDLELFKQALEEGVNNRIEKEISEADESGWSIVYKDGTYYEKKTTIYDNAIVNIYNPILKVKEPQKRKKKL